MINSDIATQLENIDKLPLSILNTRRTEWNELLNPNKKYLSSRFFEQWPPEGSTETEGWVETQWHQNSPFKNFCPMDGDTRCVAGCPAIAIAQIINYHQETHNTRFNDTDDYEDNYQNYFIIDDDHEKYDFPSFPELNNYLITLENHYINDIVLTNDDKAALAFACGVAAKQVYTASISGTFGVHQAYDAYLKFGCNNVELLDDKNPDLYDRINQDIKNAYPVHLALVTPDWNTGHNMIIDGYNTDGFYHINFGWGGTDDGWYKLPDENIPYGLTVIEGVIVDIMKDNTGPDLDCEGSLVWSNIQPGSTLEGSFNIKNIGEQGSLLNWKIESYPGWGTWTFSQQQGSDLKPEDEPITINVSVIAPNKKNKDFHDGVKIVNKESKGDICYVPITLSTPKNKTLIKQLFPLFLLNKLISYFNSI